MGDKPKSLLKKSQGGFISWFFVIVILLGVAVFFLVLNKAYGEIKTPLDEGLSSSMPTDSSVNVSTILNQTSSSTLLIDKLLPFLIIGLIAFVMIVAGSIMKHPIMIIVGIIVLGVVILLAVIYSNLYQSISESDSFASTSAQLPIQSKFLQYLPIIVIIAAVGIVVSILWRNQGSTGL